MKFISYENYQSIGKPDIEHRITGEANFTNKCTILCMYKKELADLVLGLKESLQKEMTFELRLEE